MQQLTIPLLVIFVAVLITAVIDLWKFKIHNAVTFPLLIAGVVYHGITNGSSWYCGVGESLLGVLFAIAILGAFYCMGGVGAGDVIQPAWGRFLESLTSRYGLPAAPRVRHLKANGPLATLVIAYRS